MEFDGFDWDDGNWPKCAVHGVTKSDIEGMFRVGLEGIFPDLAHSLSEVRLLAMGRDADGRWLLVAFTARMKDSARLVRPISARFMHAREVARYAHDQDE